MAANPRPPDPARILIVDDQPELLRLMERMLDREHDCKVAGGNTEARAQLAKHSFELVLCDIEMPDGSGLELAEELARERPHTSVVLVSGVDDPEVARQGFDLGVHGYLVKPFGRSELQITVINALERRRLEIAQEAHTRTLEARLQTIIDRAPMPIYAKDRAFRYVIANREAARLAGIEPEELIGKTDDAISPRSAAEHARAGDQLIFDGAPSYEERETLMVGGQERIFLTIKFPLVDEQGRVFAVSGMSPDVTAQAEAERLREALTESQREAIRELRDSRLETTERLARALELHDHGTGLHIGRMAAVSAVLAQRFGLDDDRVELLRTAAPMHDIGKIGILGDLLRKPGKLTPAEREEVERHALIGYQLLAESESELLRLAATIALTHQEHFDGRGYPNGLAGEEIPIEGRLVAVADVFDALLSDRSYRSAMTLAEAVELITSESGTHFDPRIVDLLVDNLDEIVSVRG
ncbi:MAG: cyclic di-GMP phosphodiesterase [Solirubrobacterales bacterium]|jgi:putative two-component system response regulator|nr:cyclic di-GMP phosphodiesterase [Solirubrobacterales bacterium]